ncbi:hypothetical protein D3C80_1150370 [compost metagenome]
MMSTRTGPIVLSTANWTIANVPPHTRIAGQVCFIPLNPSMINTRTNATTKLTKGMIYEVLLAISRAEMSVSEEGVVTGIPIAP